MAKIDQNEAIKLYAQGWKKSDLAKKYGVTITAITKFLRRRGIDDKPEAAQKIIKASEKGRKKVDRKAGKKRKVDQKVDQKVDRKVDQEVDREEVDGDTCGLDFFKELEETYRIAQAILKEARNSQWKDEKIALTSLCRQFCAFSTSSMEIPDDLSVLICLPIPDLLFWVSSIGPTNPAGMRCAPGRKITKYYLQSLPISRGSFIPRRISQIPAPPGVR